MLKLSSRKSYDAAERELTSAWKSRFPIHGEAEGDICTINGAPGHLRKKDGELVCIPDAEPRARKVTQRNPYGPTFKEPSEHEWNLTGPLSDGQSAKQQAYDSYRTELENAWRTN